MGAVDRNNTTTKNRQHKQKTYGKMVDSKPAIAMITSNVNVENIQKKFRIGGVDIKDLYTLYTRNLF